MTFEEPQHRGGADGQAEVHSIAADGGEGSRHGLGRERGDSGAQCKLFPPTFTGQPSPPLLGAPQAHTLPELGQQTQQCQRSRALEAATRELLPLLSPEHGRGWWAELG